MIEDQVELSNAPNPTYADKFEKKMHLGLLGLSDFYRLTQVSNLCEFNSFEFDCINKICSADA